METKYYTPTIEEFHIGFEFEEEFKNYHWAKMIRPNNDEYQFIKLTLDTSHSISRITSKLKDNRVRVKCLDKEDIESLGLKVKITDCGQDTEDYPDIYKDGVIIGSFDPREEFNITLFCNISFKIKNKSELKILLKQLGLYEEQV